MTPCKPGLLALWMMVALGILFSDLTPMAPAQAQPIMRVEAGQAKQFISDLGAQAIAVLQQAGQPIERREAIFRDMLARKFAMGFIGRFALGRYWQTATTDQQDEYLSLFSEFVLRNYASMLGGYVDEKFEVLDAAEAGKLDMIVGSRITGGGREPIRVDWRLRMIDGQPQIIDVSVGGISMSITQREEYSALVQRTGIEGLLEVLRARTLGLPAEGPE
jgi:phospholipid transport system substrate-binding protein